MNVNDNHQDIQETFFVSRNDLASRYAGAISTFLALPGLRGFWPMSYSSIGDAWDQSNNGAGRYLTYTGNATYNYTGLISYIDMDNNDYLTRPDEVGLDITGTETYVANPGLTMGGWFQSNEQAAFGGYIGKWTTTGNQRSYLIFQTNDSPPIIRAVMSNAGAATEATALGSAITLNTWFFAAARFTPSTELKLWINKSTTSDTTAVPASIFNSSAPFQVGAYNAGATNVANQAALCFLCASAVSDAHISALYENSRILFGI